MKSGARHVAHVAVQTVHRVARVLPVASEPHAAQHRLKHAPLYLVGALYAQDGGEPVAREAQSDDGRHDSAQKQGALREAAFRLMGGGVDASLGGPDEGKVEPHADDAREGVGDAAQAYAATGAEKPSEGLYGRCRIHFPYKIKNFRPYPCPKRELFSNFV